LISWLLKDLGWMTTNVYLGWIFGGVAVLLHLAVLFIDWPHSVPFRFYHSSLVLWIVGNFLWMSVEFMVYRESSDVHFGPHTPVGGMTVKVGDQLTEAKSWLFLTAIAIQFLLFILIRMNILAMPLDVFDDDSIDGGSVDMDMDIDGSQQSASAPLTSTQEGQPLVEDMESNDNRMTPSNLYVADKYPFGFTLTFIENSYIVLWIAKDYFWSWATGDFEVQQRVGYFTEVVSMFFGILSVCLYTYIAYAWRKHFVNMMDSLTSWCWLFANFVWMAGEVFIRYDNLQLDDAEQADDAVTRLVSGIFFLIGMQIQFIVIFHEMIDALKSRERAKLYSKSRLEMMPVTNIDVDYDHIVSLEMID